MREGVTKMSSFLFKVQGGIKTVFHIMNLISFNVVQHIRFSTLQTCLSISVARGYAEILPRRDEFRQVKARELFAQSN